ncbi:hypothetical protein [Alicyclobacillus dauci]|uniref:Uncharacterized protein n=1 Tax=Alicyclobacillus dauci TaxID=1475485 RepID=A0ABY6Z6G2_9BACL|nr:hypothetical protein [Alicyclobacillus dauci]WAH38460.1 hypothetical protein NZD86_08260 [Alicyclobacillus dauci]
MIGVSLLLTNDVPFAQQERPRSEIDFAVGPLHDQMMGDSADASLNDGTTPFCTRQPSAPVTS